MSHAKGRVAHASSRYSDYAGWYEMQARHCMPAHTVQHRVDGISNLAERDTAVTLLVPADKPNGGLHRQGSSSSASAPSTPVGASPRLTRPSPARDVDDQEFENAMTVMLQEVMGRCYAVCCYKHAPRASMKAAMHLLGRCITHKACENIHSNIGLP